MRRALVIILALAVVLSGLFFGRSKLQPQTDPDSPALFPEIAFEDITSGKMARNLFIADKLGLLPKIDDKAVAARFRKTSDRFMEEAGFSRLDMLYPAPSVAPYVWAAFYKTRIEGSDYFVLVQKWRNPDKSVVFLPLLIAAKNSLDDGVVTPYYRGLFDEGYYPAPYIDFASLPSCQSALAFSPDWCDWFFANKPAYDELIDGWTASGILPKATAEMPFMFTKMVLPAL